MELEQICGLLKEGSGRNNLLKWTIRNITLIVALGPGPAAESQAAAWLEALPDFGLSSPVVGSFLDQQGKKAHSSTLRKPLFA